MKLYDKFKDSKELKEIIEKIGRSENLKISGLFGASKDFLIAVLYKILDKPMIVIVPDEDDSSIMASNLEFFSKLIDSYDQISSKILDPQNNAISDIICFPGTRCEPFELLSTHSDISSQRIHALYDLTRRERFCLVTSAVVTCRKILPKNIFLESIIELSKNIVISSSELALKLVKNGYRRVDTVMNIGDFSIRGGIIDVYSPGFPHPLRIDLFGDEIESIRFFNPMNQRSMDHTGDAVILPMTEFIIDKRGLKPLETILNQTLDIEDLELQALYQEAVKKQVQFHGIEALSPIYYDGLVDLFSYITDDALIITIDADVAREKINKSHDLIKNDFSKTDFYKNLGLNIDDYIISHDRLIKTIEKRNNLQIDSLSLYEPESDVHQIEFSSSILLPKRNPHIVSILERVNEIAGPIKEIIITCENERRIPKLEKEISRERQDSLYSKNARTELIDKNIKVNYGNLTSGFIFPQFDTAFIPEAELFGKRRSIKQDDNFKFRKFQSDFSDLKIKDYIVHVDHGIGQYQGLIKIKHDEDEHEFLFILYADGDKLYLPMDRLYLVQKYVSSGSYIPRLDKLGSTNWIRIKKKAKLAIRMMAEELLNLYASREMTEGISFSPDSLWQREFEAGFQFEETRDQYQAIEDVKHDMESTRPMDRLVCGDVGYGKTEVAIRAAFKSVMDGKQTAVLVPTTVLAQQHYQTFADRMRSYPVSVEMLSRFRSKTEQKKIVEDLSKGKVDIIIGTHRLLQKDLKFKDLGLLIVDEEHRFGVKDKEKIKTFKTNIDVLTLTATPIPRTLHMALSQIRNLSIIDTPPENRLPIHTVVARFNRYTIKDAIRKEMDRGGQIYFIHNRVQSIENMARLIGDLVPEARIAVAHGQMNENQLEKVMIKFLRKDYDVLVCSAIIESGIDIPAVNTIIINRADTFGLAQLYQLRGRVGRDKYQAYAYLLIPGQKLITDTARKRLEIIQELTDLGSGFKIATHDLELRGAGNILGAEQHGHINSIGFDLYMQLLEKTIGQLKGQSNGADFVSHVDIPTGAKIPEFYISDDNQRLMMYKKVSMIRTFDELSDIKQEFTDRFGPIPDEVIDLLRIAEIRITARDLMIKEISQVENSLKFSFDNATPIEPEQMVKIIHRFPKRIRFLSSNEMLYDLPFKVKYDIIDQIKTIFGLLS
jgi:transcription-repair coupling factor (superfamily II helicase)